MENHTFFLPNTQDTIMKQLALAKDDKEVLRPFIQDNNQKHPVQTKIFQNVFVKVKNHG